ncbi:MAG TPA: hypothetical protein VMF08_23160 [Candidatus Sulfotelmatobacter sp.]|nr:hypothetical protein [Candidatus Sulfotelmatobacter sp.]
MKNLITIAVAGLLATVAFQGRALIVVPSQTVSFEGVSDGHTLPNDRLYITYEVNEIQTGVYEYSYGLTTYVPEALTSFTIGGNSDPLDTTGMKMLDYGCAEQDASGFDSNSVGWVWGFDSDVTDDDVSYTSPIAPGDASFTVNDDGIEWSSPALIPAPVSDSAPVPEPSALALLVASAFAFCLMKDRLKL